MYLLFSLMNKSLSAFSGLRRDLFLSMINPALEKTRSAEVEVDLELKYFLAILVKTG